MAWTSLKACEECHRDCSHSCRTEGQQACQSPLQDTQARVRWVPRASLSSRKTFSTSPTSIPSDAEGQGFTGLGTLPGKVWVQGPHCDLKPGLAFLAPISCPEVSRLPTASLHRTRSHQSLNKARLLQICREATDKRGSWGCHPLWLEWLGVSFTVAASGPGPRAGLER